MRGALNHAVAGSAPEMRVSGEHAKKSLLVQGEQGAVDEFSTFQREVKCFQNSFWILVAQEVEGFRTG